MTIDITCEQCGKSLTIDDKYAGTTGKCSGCGAPVFVPQAPEGKSEDAIPELAPKKRRGIRAEIARLLDEDQDPKLVDLIYKKVSDILTTDEKVTYVCVQKKPLVNPWPDALVLTNRRFIIYRPRIMSVTFEDYTWRSLRDAELAEGVIGAKITLTTTNGKKLSIGFLPKIQARKVYAIVQGQEERIHEERRRRELEDKRAAAGGIVLNQPGGSAGSAPGASQDPVDRLKKLKEMLDAGLISPGEFEAKRAEIIESM